MLQVFYASVDSLDLTNLPALPAHRRIKIDAYRRDDDKRRSLGAWLLLRRAFKEIGTVPGDEWAVSANGKPYFADSPLHFSLSHSGSYAAAAISDSPCGVDIEMIGRCREAVVRRYFTEDESRYAAGDETKFTEIWTRKEAIVKARGTGLSEISSFSAYGDVFPFRLTSFFIPSGYVISAAGTSAASLTELEI